MSRAVSLTLTTTQAPPQEKERNEKGRTCTACVVEETLRCSVEGGASLPNTILAYPRAAQEIVQHIWKARDAVCEKKGSSSRVTLYHVHPTPDRAFRSCLIFLLDDLVQWMLLYTHISVCLYLDGWLGRV